MTILVINSGSSSLKMSSFGQTRLNAHLKGKPVAEALTLAVDQLKIQDASLIGHRFVHGGERYCEPVLLDDAVLADLYKMSELAPLHNAACLEGIEAAKKLFPGVPQVAVFDTAFHTHMPEVASKYAIDEKYGIKRYGFHGISNAFLTQAYDAYTGQKKHKLVTMHLGSGCSMTAIRDGTSIDTSMGFTPADGLVMGTRAGDIDAAVVEYLCRHDKMTVSEVLHTLNFASGLLGVSSKTANMEELLRSSHPKAKLAVNLFCYRVLKYLGAYTTVLEGADAYIFSGGIGENAAPVRSQIIRGMQWFGVQLDAAANDKAIGLPLGEVRKISSSSSSIAVFVIATDENALIARQVQACAYGHTLGQQQLPLEK